MPFARRLHLLALPLTFFVIVAGAFVRLSDAGLGCPDWPGCYGELIGVADEETATARYPQGEYDLKKAWIEVGHRYIAGVLGLLLLAAAVADWRRRRRLGLAQLLLLAVVAQALLGMLTVTDKLRPIVVVAHLLGGLLILSLLVAVCVNRPLSASPSAAARKRLLSWWNVAAAALVVQIALGGWVSSNYAGLACPDFPLCQGGWTPPAADFSGFYPWRELHRGADGQAISNAALTTIHWVHRLGAALLLVVFVAFAAVLWRGGCRRESRGLMAVLLLQIGVGVSVVMWQLPLWAAVAHNAVAAVLVIKVSGLRVKLARI